MSKGSENLPGLLLSALECACMAAGAYRGELKILFSKAINICLECIGIGK